MVVELATILLAVAAAVALVLYAAPKGYLGHPRKKAISDVAAAKPATTFTPEVEATEPKPTEAPVAAEPAPPPEPEPTPAPSPAPAIYETVQPATSPALPPPPVSGSPVLAFGASSSAPRLTRTYKRRTPPSRTSSAARAAARRVKKQQ